jgi:hypothetical protein
MTDALYCRSHRGGVPCTRELDHRGLHHARGTNLLWQDADADAPACPGSGEPAAAAETLPDGFPHGRALCPVCLGFFALDGGLLVPHDRWTGQTTDADAADRREWFNTIGW